MNLEKLLAIALESSKKAGIEVNKHYQQGTYTSEIKDDNSPVTSADIAANDVIGTIDFQAPDEGTGTDAILVAAGIAAVSEGLGN